ncbi:MAG TPA: hypothetical protein VF609_00260, partial [Flavisolibacter sp.]
WPARDWDNGRWNLWVDDLPGIQELVCSLFGSEGRPLPFIPSPKEREASAQVLAYAVLSLRLQLIYYL